MIEVSLFSGASEKRIHRRVAESAEQSETNFNVFLCVLCVSPVNILSLTHPELLSTPIQ